MVHKFDVFVLSLVFITGIILLTMVIFAKQKKIFSLEEENEALRALLPLAVEPKQLMVGNSYNCVAEENRRWLATQNKWREEFDEFE